MQAHLDTFPAFVDQEAGGTGLPTFVTDEFDAFLACGIEPTAFCAYAATAAPGRNWWPSF